MKADHTVIGEFSDELKQKWKEEEFNRKMNLPLDSKGLKNDITKFIVKSKVRDGYHAQYAAAKNVTLEVAQKIRWNHCPDGGGYQTFRDALDFYNEFLANDEDNQYKVYYIIDRASGATAYDPVNNHIYNSEF